jgi:hypothetical protein
MAMICAWKAIFDGMNAKEVEALAFLEGVRLAAEWSQSKAIIESDYSTVVLAACRAGVDKSQLAFIVNDIKYESSLLARVRFQFVRREQNEISHELA